MIGIEKDNTMIYKLFFLILLLPILAGCGGEAGREPVYSLDPAAAPNLQDFGPAPELTNTTWINTDQPLRIKDLRGKVVLIDMWTFG